MSKKNTNATTNAAPQDDNNKKGKKEQINPALKKINESIPDMKAKDGQENTKEGNRFLGELKRLASEKDKETQSVALAKLSEAKKTYSERAGTPGHDKFGNKLDTLASHVCSVLSTTPMRMKEITHALKVLSAKIKRPDLFKTTYYDICNKLHDIGVLGKTNSNEYFVADEKSKKKGK